jgi:pullulanase/glycogen debranching enzyme
MKFYCHELVTLKQFQQFVKFTNNLITLKFSNPQINLPSFISHTIAENKLRDRHNITITHEKYKRKMWNSILIELFEKISQHSIIHTHFELVRMWFFHASMCLFFLCSISLSHTTNQHPIMIQNYSQWGIHIVSYVESMKRSRILCTVGLWKLVEEDVKK